MHFYCKACGRQYPIEGLDYKCACGGLFSLHKEPGEKISSAVSLGEIETPMLERALDGLKMNLKLDYMRPTGSFKDRGAYTLINAIKERGVKEVVEDSSGNAGSAIAGYSAAAGIKCAIYLREATSEGKIRQAESYGAEVRKIAGSRDDVGEAVLDAAKTTYYASHSYNPLFFEGMKSMVPEIIKQAGIPDCVLAPVANGTLLLGLYLGFKEAGRLPKIIAVQSSHCAPVYARFNGMEPGPVTPTVAEGIAVGAPTRIDEIVAAIRESGGSVVTVEDSEVMAAKEKLGLMGIYIEATSGAAPAGAIKYFAGRETDGLNIVVPLTGSGLKK